MLKILNKNNQKRLTIRQLFYIIVIAILSGYGGIGRRVRLRGVWETVRVQVPITAPSKNASRDRLAVFCCINSLKIKAIYINQTVLQ